MESLDRLEQILMNQPEVYFFIGNTDNTVLFLEDTFKLYEDFFNIMEAEGFGHYENKTLYGVEVWSDYFFRGAYGLIFTWEDKQELLKSLHEAYNLEEAWDDGDYEKVRERAMSFEEETNIPNFEGLYAIVKSNKIFKWNKKSLKIRSKGLTELTQNISQLEQATYSIINEQLLRNHEKREDELILFLQEEAFSH